MVGIGTRSENVKKWGFFGHKRINRIATFTLPPEMFGFFKEHIEYLTEHAVDPDKRMRKLAVTAAKVHGLAVAGVDLIHSKRGLLLLEVNSSPGLEGIERVTGVEVAEAIVGLLERNGR